MIDNKINLIYKMNGNVDSLDINDVASLLTSLSNIIQEGNKILSTTGRKIGINIKPIEKGSFIIDIALFAQTHAEQLVTIMNSNDIQELKNILECLGFLSCGATGLLGVIKWLNGKNIEKTEPVNNKDVKIFNAEGNNISINIGVLNLYNSQIIKNNISNVIIKPLEKEDINSITSYIKDNKENTEEIIDKSIINDIRTYSLLPINTLEKGDKEIYEEIYISPKRGSFSGESNEWSFRHSVNNNIIKVDVISDDVFLQKCKSGEIRPFERDMLKVKFKIIFNQEKNKIKKTELIEVLEYIKYKEQQMNLL